MSAPGAPGRPRTRRLLWYVLGGLAAALGLLALLAPHLFRLFHPPALPENGAPLRLSGGGAGPQQPVEILVDDRGIPHIFGASEADLAYGLGFMHARDRLFQLQLFKHAALGRLTELFGEELLEADRELRLVSVGLEAQFNALSERDKVLLTHYAAGVNAGARHASRTAEMALLGVHFEEFHAQDSLAIARLQAWDLAQDRTEEWARSRILARLPPSDPRRALFLAPVPSGGVAVVPGAAPVPSSAPVPQTPPPALPGGDEGPLGLYERPLPPRAQAILAAVRARGPAGSNAWAVAGDKTRSGHAVLCNDPHLAHSAPAAFYLAHLEHPGFTAAGATVAGVPAVVIGFTRHLAWGLTVSFADTQDLVRIHPAPGKPGHYLLDGVPTPYGQLEQVFKLGDSPSARQVRESWRTTVFGPVLPGGYDEKKEPGDELAILWAGFQAGGRNEHMVSGFWDLAQARTEEEATAAIEKFSLAGQNVLLAFTDGAIAYRLAAMVPIRSSSELISLPRDGEQSSAGWSGFLTAEQKPRLTRPQRGYIVSANQRVVEEGGVAAEQIGGIAALPNRARRITELLEAQLSSGKPATEELAAIQQDVVSLEGRELAPLLGKVCPARLPGQPDTRVQAFCEAVRGFDGTYSTGSTGALPFTLLMEELKRELIHAHLGRELERLMKPRDFLNGTLSAALLAERAGRPSALFDDPATPEREGLERYVEGAAARALASLVERAGEDPAGWRWGKLHTLSFESPLAEIPVIGALFATERREEPGHSEAPRAEGGLPVTEGAAFRMVVELSSPPTGRIALATGNSDRIGARHWDDGYSDWSRGNLRPLPTSREEIERQLEGRILLLP